jgi:hypothetical protein
MSLNPWNRTQYSDVPFELPWSSLICDAISAARNLGSHTTIGACLFARRLAWMAIRADLAKRLKKKLPASLSRKRPKAAVAVGDRTYPGRAYLGWRQQGKSPDDGATLCIWMPFEALVSERFFEFLESAHRAFLSVSTDNFKLLCVDSI